MTCKYCQEHAQAAIVLREGRYYVECACCLAVYLLKLHNLKEKFIITNS